MPLEPLLQWRCDSCGRLIERPRHGTVTYGYVPNAEPYRRHVDFRIVHNGNVENGVCQGAAHADILLDDLVRERGILKLLGRQSIDPSWAETVRRVLVPHYEEARAWFDAARADGLEVIDEKLSKEKLLAIIKMFTS